MEGIKAKKNLLLILLSTIVLSILWILYIPLLDGYFITDDIAIVWYAATQSLGEIFFSPEHRFSGANFTPLVVLSFKIDWLLFNMEPKGYYIHNLTSVIMAGCALFLFIRLYTGNLAALIAVILFLLNPVVLSVFSWSSSRHYMEGLSFALVSLYLFIRANRTGKLSILSGCLYLLSALYKEVYVLVPLVAVFISKGNTSQRLKYTIPFWVGLFIYTVWRFWILHGFGGYPTADSLGLRSIITGIHTIIEILPFHLFGSYHALFWIVIAAMFISLYPKKKILKPALLLALLLVPILPVINMFDVHHGWARYVFHLCIFLTCIGILWGRDTFKQRGWRGGVVILVLITVLTLFFIRDNSLKASIYKDNVAARETTEEFLYSGKEYMQATQPAWVYEWMRDIQSYLYGRKINTKIIPDKILIPYSSKERRQEIKSQGYNWEPAIEKELRRDVIDGTIQIDGYRITWDIGPYRDGKYIILRGDHKGLFNNMTHVRRNGTYLFGKIYPDGKPHIFYLRVVYQSPEGWEAITGEYKIEIPGTQNITLE